MTELNLWLGFGNIICGAINAALAFPLIRGKIKRNEIYGIRTKTSIKSEEEWLHWNKVGGLHMLQWSVVIALLGFTCLWVPPLSRFWIWFFGLAPTLVLIGCVQTYFRMQRN